MEKYIFTFGFGQKDGDISLDNCYVEVYAKDKNGARNIMIENYGLEWAFQYDPPHADKKAGVKKYGLVKYDVLRM